MPVCSHRTCRNSQSDLSIRLFGQKGYFLDDDWYCSEECLEVALHREIDRKLSTVLGHDADPIQRPLIGLILLESALISREQLQQALDHQKQDRSEQLGHVLQRMGFVQERDITAALARQSGFPRMNLERIVANEAILGMIPPRIARLARLFPIEYDPERNKLWVVMAAPDRSVVATLGKMLGLDVYAYIGDETLLEEIIDQYYPKNSDLGNVEEATFAVSMGIATIAREIIDRMRKLKSRDIWVEKCGEHLWVRIALETEAYNLFLSFQHHKKDSILLDAPLR